MSIEQQHAGEKPTADDTGYFSPPPAVTLPKGGGAIQGIGETFSANPITGSASLRVPLVEIPGRSGYSLQLSLSYDSGTGNGPFGFGWSLTVPSIARKTEKGLPRYQDAQDTDIFLLSQAEDLVPTLTAPGEALSDQSLHGKLYSVRSYRPRVEGAFARIQRWQNKGDATDSFWKAVSKENVTNLYGTTANSRIADPADTTKIFQWLLAESYDDKGNRIAYFYKNENLEGVDRSSPQ